MRKLAMTHGPADDFDNPRVWTATRRRRTSCTA
jgi:hypothetical protein